MNIMKNKTNKPISADFAHIAIVPKCEKKYHKKCFFLEFPSVKILWNELETVLVLKVNKLNKLNTS